MLSMRFGRKAEIWRDSKLNGNDIFADEIVQQFPKTELLISVFTPRYVESEWCTREVSEFCKYAASTGGLVVDNKSRVLKVIKMPVDDERPLPAVMREALGYPFYDFDEQQVPLELDPAYGEEFTRKYNLKLAKLAFDVAGLIKKIESPRRPATGLRKVPQAAASKPAIYLADCSFDRRSAREALESELRLHGYPVFPDIQLPKDGRRLHCRGGRIPGSISVVHSPVGTKYGVVPDGPSEKSVTVLQNELAIESYREGGLRRIISLPKVQRRSPRLSRSLSTSS